MQDFVLRMIACIQTVAIATRVWRGSQAALLKLVAPMLPDVNELEWPRYFRDPDVHRELYLRDVALWQGKDGKFRLIAQEPPSNVSQALRFFNSKARHGCLFCRLDDPDDEMLQMSDGGVMHALCRRPYYRWKRISLMSDHQATPWFVTLGFPSPDVTASQVRLAYRRLAREFHPDKGGDTIDMVKINAARDRGLESCQTH